MKLEPQLFSPPETAPDQPRRYTADVEPFFDVWTCLIVDHEGSGGWNEVEEVSFAEAFDAALRFVLASKGEAKMQVDFHHDWIRAYHPVIDTSTTAKIGTVIEDIDGSFYAFFADREMLGFFENLEDASQATLAGGNAQ